MSEKRAANRKRDFSIWQFLLVKTDRQRLKSSRPKKHMFPHFPSILMKSPIDINKNGKNFQKSSWSFFHLGEQFHFNKFFGCQNEITCLFVLIGDFIKNWGKVGEHKIFCHEVFNLWLSVLTSRRCRVKNFLFQFSALTVYMTNKRRLD